jgi:hypothetical protein
VSWGFSFGVHGGCGGPTSGGGDRGPLPEVGGLAGCSVSASNRRPGGRRCRPDDSVEVIDHQQDSSEPGYAERDAGGTPREARAAKLRLATPARIISSSGRCNVPRLRKQRGKRSEDQQRFGCEVGSRWAKRLIEIKAMFPPNYPPQNSRLTLWALSPGSEPHRVSCGLVGVSP